METWKERIHWLCSVQGDRVHVSIICLHAPTFDSRSALRRKARSIDMVLEYMRCTVR